MTVERRRLGPFTIVGGASIGLAAAVASGRPILGARWSLFWLLVVWAGSWLIGVALVFRLPPRLAIPAVLVLAVGLRVAALAGPPTTSDDLYRYAWDGRVQAAGVDPYALPPASPDLAGQRDGWLWPDADGCAALHRPSGCTRINRPAVRTIYPPVAEAWFATVSRATGGSARHKPWQVAGLAVDLATVAALLVALRRWDRDPRWIALYALSPVPVLEFVNNGHVDGLAIAFVAAALAVAGETRAEHRRDIAFGLLVGAAALVKIYPGLLLIAAVGLPSIRPGRPLWRAASAAGALAAVCYLPHVLAVGPHVIGYLPGYLREEHYDQGGRFLLAGLGGLSGWPALVAAVVAMLVAIGWVIHRKPSAPVAAAVLLAALLLVVTPVQPWYAAALLAATTLVPWPAAVAVVLAGYPYFFAVILDYQHAIGLGRVAFAAAAAGYAARSSAMSVVRQQ